MAVMDSLILEAVNKGVMLRWKAETVDETENSSNMLDAEQDDSALTLISGAALVTLGTFLL